MHFRDPVVRPGRRRIRFMPESHVVALVTEDVAGASRQTTHVRQIPGLGKFRRTQDLLSIVFAIILDQPRELHDIVNGHVQAPGQKWHASFAAGFFGEVRRHVADTNRRVYLVDQHGPEIRIIAFFLFKQTTERSRQQKYVAVAVTDMLSGSPGMV